jgi:hypothetical protein
VPHVRQSVRGPKTMGKAQRPLFGRNDADAGAAKSVTRIGDRCGRGWRDYGDVRTRRDLLFLFVLTKALGIHRHRNETHSRRTRGQLSLLK